MISARDGTTRWSTDDFRCRSTGPLRGDVFTDVYLEKGADSNCLRYHLEARGKGTDFTESAIANGVIVCTSAGSTGYYSYIDKLRTGTDFQADRFTQIGADEIGVCHIAPVSRNGTGHGRHRSAIRCLGAPASG